MLQWVVLLFCIFGFCYYSLKVCLIIAFCLYNNIYFQLVFFLYFLTSFVLCFNLGSKICEFINPFKPWKKKVKVEKMFVVPTAATFIRNNCPLFSADCTGKFVSTPFCPTGIKMAVHIKTLQTDRVATSVYTWTEWHSTRLTLQSNTHLPVVQTTKNTRGVLDQRLLNLTLLDNNDRKFP